MTSSKADYSRQDVKDKATIVGPGPELTYPNSPITVQTGLNPNQPHDIRDTANNPPPTQAERIASPATVPITNKSLAEHNRQEAQFWADPARVFETLQEQAQTLKDAAESLGIDASMLDLGDMEQGFGGLTPMERFVEKLKSS